MLEPAALVVPQPTALPWPHGAGSPGAWPRCTLAAEPLRAQLGGCDAARPTSPTPRVPPLLGAAAYAYAESVEGSMQLTLSRVGGGAAAMAAVQSAAAGGLQSAAGGVQSVASSMAEATRAVGCDVAQKTSAAEEGEDLSTTPAEVGL